MPHTQLRALATRWATTTLGERQAFQSWFRDFCDALGVEQPAPHENGVYCFEQPVKVITNDGNLTTNFIDCWKAGHFAVEGRTTLSFGCQRQWQEQQKGPGILRSPAPTGNPQSI